MAEEEHDRVCMHCGEIMSGPNKGDKVDPGHAQVTLPEGQFYREHKGRKLTHCGGHGCQEEMEADIRYYQDLDRRKQERQRSKKSIAAEAREEKRRGGSPKERKIQSGPRVSPKVQEKVSFERQRQNALKKLTAWERSHSTRIPKNPNIF